MKFGIVIGNGVTDDSAELGKLSPTAKAAMDLASAMLDVMNASKADGQVKLKSAGLVMAITAHGFGMPREVFLEFVEDCYGFVAKAETRDIKEH